MRHAIFFALASCIPFNIVTAQENDVKPIELNAKSVSPFTGRLTRNKVRLRNKPSLEGQIIRELNKGDMVVVLEETEEFYAIQPLSDTKAYVFRTFVLDNQIEGDHVNVRLLPDLDAPIIAQLNSGDRVEGIVSSLNNKWLEIAPPLSSRFYVCKDYIEKIGDAQMMTVIAKRREEVNALLQSTYQTSQEEMQKPFSEINLERIHENYQTIMSSFADFPDQAERAKELSISLQEQYLNRKISYLENKATEKAYTFLENKQSSIDEQELISMLEEELSGRAALWLPQERTLYEVWAEASGGSIEEFYSLQKEKAITLEGLLESYKRPVKNRPGDFLLVSKLTNLPIAYLYSTKIDLEGYVGQEITIEAVERTNNHFAFPAYFVLSVD